MDSGTKAEVAIGIGMQGDRMRKLPSWTYSVLFFLLLLAFFSLLDSPFASISMSSLPPMYWVDLAGILLLACVSSAARRISLRNYVGKWQGRFTLFLGILITLGACISSINLGWKGGTVLVASAGMYILLEGVWYVRNTATE